MRHRERLRAIRRHFAPLGVKNANLLAGFLLNPFENRRISRGSAVIIAFQDKAAVGGGTDHADGPDILTLKRQNPVIFEKNHAFTRGFQRECEMLFTLDLVIRNRVIFGTVKEPQFESCRKETHRRFVNLFLRHETVGKRGQKMQVHHAAIQITPRVHRESGRFNGRLGNAVPGMKVFQRPAVGYDVSAKTPSAAKDIPKKERAPATRFSVGPVIRTHNGFDPSFDDAGLKSGKIRLPQILVRYPGVKFMSQRFGPAVNGEMFGARRRTHIRAVSLKSANEGDAQPARKKRVLPVCLVPSSPAGISEQIDIRRPESEPLIDVPIVLQRGSIILRPAFDCDGRRDSFKKGIVKGRSQADRLRKTRRGPRTRHSVERFVPPIVRRYAEAGDGGRLICQLPGFLFDGHASDKLLRTRSKIVWCIHLMLLPESRISDANAPDIRAR